MEVETKLENLLRKHFFSLRANNIHNFFDLPRMMIGVTLQTEAREQEHRRGRKQYGIPSELEDFSSSPSSPLLRETAGAGCRRFELRLEHISWTDENIAQDNRVDRRYWGETEKKESVMPDLCGDFHLTLLLI